MTKMEVEAEYLAREYSEVYSRLLEKGYSDGWACRWMHAPNDKLEGRTPYYWVRSGKKDMVMAEVERLAAVILITDLPKEEEAHPSTPLERQYWEGHFFGSPISVLAGLCWMIVGVLAGLLLGALAF